jgi:hypothetical protein
MYNKGKYVRGMYMNPEKEKKNKGCYRDNDQLIQRCGTE